MRSRLLRALTIAAALLCMPLAGPTAAQSSSAGPMDRAEVPAPLKPWVPWAMYGSKESPCPAFNGSDARVCVWPGRLALELNAGGGKFSQDLRVYGEPGVAVWSALPGSAARWPQEVQVDGKPQAVLQRNDAPGLYLLPGEHRLSGRFAWAALPESLNVPAGTGMVSLVVSGKAVEEPRWDENGLLTLASAGRETRAAESVELRVFRLISDDIPLTITTRITLLVAGKNREISLPGVLPEGALPTALASPLPARLDAERKLMVQVRPGQWQITLQARLPGAQTALKAPVISGVSEEVWAFAARPALRQVTLQGPPQIDPQQTSLPQEWRGYPAYRIKGGETLALSETRRGDAAPNPDQLTLSRNIWLDFNGRGYTVRDDITGTLSQAWRLGLGAPYVLGRAAINSRDQLITTGADREAGIEVRVGQANLTADSRLEGASRELPAVGWSFGAQNLSAVLHLPPGWRLLGASGVDQAHGAWVSRWSLLDFFLVLIATVAALRLWGIAWGAAMLGLLVLTWQEPGAPRWAWIDLVAAVALARAFAATRLGPWLTRYRALAWLAVLVIALPFAVQEVRATLYPSLDEPSQESGGGFGMLLADKMYKVEAPVPADAPAPAAAPPVEAPAQQADGERLKQESEDRRSEIEARIRSADVTPPAKVAAPAEPKTGALSVQILGGSLSSSTVANVRVDEIDPKAVVQTGPGLPAWHWRDYQLEWSGPVEKSQQIRLWLLPPWLKGLLVVLHLLLTAALLARVFDAFDAAAPLAQRLRGLMRGRRAAAWLLPLALCALAAPGREVLAAAPPAPQVSAAETASGGTGFPGDALLDKLRERLRQPAPACRPNCADINRLRVEVSGNQLRLRMEIHAADATAVPLPGGPRQWLPEAALLDGKPAPVLRASGNQVWVAVGPGVHQLVLEGALPARDTVQLALPLKPRHVESALSGWQLDGVDADGGAESSLQLTRSAQPGAKGAAGATAVEGNIPPFVVVERTLVLGLEWRVLTRVARVTAGGLPLVLELPLLPGESVITPDVKSENGKARISLAPQANEASFESTLQIRPEISLAAGKGSDWVEIWRLDAGTQWHVDLGGIPMIARQSGGRYLPQWQPWPGESVSIKVAKPAAVAGAWLTLDSATLAVTPGSRVTDLQLTLALRASRGGEQLIELPADFTLQEASLKGRSEPLKLEQGKLKLPIAPGAQQIILKLRAPEGMGLAYRTPQIKLNLPGLNQQVNLELPRDRWLLWFDGPRLGPAILLWGVVLVLALVGYALGRVPASPLKSWQWILLLLGLTQAGVISGVIIVGWLFALAARERYAGSLTQRRMFNFAQVALALLTLLALLLLLEAVRSTLLGTPEMQVTGNGSSSYSLNWYQDRGDFPVVSLYSLPMLVWRGIMLAWALWLAWSLIAWLRWGWTAFSTGTLWRKRPPRPVAPAAAPQPDLEEPVAAE